MRIIGITGTNGSGKGTVVEVLEKHGFVHFSASGFLAKEVKRRGLEVTRDNLGMVGNELRKKYGPGYVFENLLKEAKKTGKDCVLEAVRTIGELAFLRSQPNVTILGVDADQRIRYERVVKRNTSVDHVTFEHFKKTEQRESSGNDPALMNIPKSIALADAVITNNGTREEFVEKVEEYIKNLPM